MKNSDLPILQFFTKKSPEKTHDMIEDINDEDDDDDEDDQLIEIEHNDNCYSKFIDEDSNSNTITCPVCQKMLLGDNDKINKHIDLCLNGEMIRTTIKEEEEKRTSPQANSHKRYLLNIYFNQYEYLVSLCSINSTQSKPTPASKRQKRKLNLTPQRINGIDNYFFKTDSSK
jgi:hypothetical protein